MRRPRISTTPNTPQNKPNPDKQTQVTNCLIWTANPFCPNLIHASPYSGELGLFRKNTVEGLPSSPLAPVDQERPTRPRSAAKSPLGRGIPAPTGLDAEALAEPDRDEAEFDETPLLCTANVAPTTQKRAPNGFSWAFQAHANGFHHCRPSAIMPLCQRSAPTLPQISAQVQHNYRLPIDQHMSFRRPIVAALYERRSLVLSVISVTTSRCRPRALTRRFVL